MRMRCFSPLFVSRALLTRFGVSRRDSESLKRLRPGSDHNPYVYTRNPSVMDCGLRVATYRRNYGIARKTGPKCNEAGPSRSQPLQLTRLSLVSNQLHSAPREGFEPSTRRLTAGCSTVELSRNHLPSSH